jgi:phage portal protein BeeE
MKNPIKSYIERQVRKALTGNENNELFQQMFRWINAGHPIWVGDQQKDYIDKGYLYNDLVHSIVKTKADAAKAVTWLAYKVTDEKAHRQYRAMSRKEINLPRAVMLRNKAMAEIDGGEISALVESPNNYQTLQEIVGEYFSWMDVMGNFYLYGMPHLFKRGIFQSVHVAPAHMVEIIAGQYYDPIAGYRIKFVQDDPIPKEQVMHIKTWNPDYDPDGRQLYGVSPLRAGGRILTIDNEGLDTSGTVFSNQGVRGFISKSPQAGDTGGSVESFKLLKERMEQLANDKSKAGQLAYTNIPAVFTEIGRSPVDLGILQSMQNNLQRLCNVFQMPVELFAPGSTFNNKQEARKSMITTAVLPSLNIFRDKINKFFYAAYGPGYWVDYDLMSITELQDDLNKITDMLAKMNWVTENEKREATNYDTYEHPLADKLFVDPNRIPMDMAMFDTSFDPIDTELSKLRNE